MKISAQKLFSLLGVAVEDFPTQVKNIANILTKVGFEVESIEHEADAFANFVVANVVECEKHPESAKLSVCKVSNGNEVFQVLCGAPNVRKGLKVVLAQKGAVIPKNGMTIQKTKIARLESNGMICSADELCIGKNDGTILELEENVAVGVPYAIYAKKTDSILDISITPNRGDGISYYGIGRELSAQGIGTLPLLASVGNVQLKSLEIDVTNRELAPSVFFTKFSVIESVGNVKNILEKSGIKPSGIPIVDALNYTTELYGQPMHVYDASRIVGNIKVRKSLDGEKLITISGQEVILSGGDIVIADDEKILSLAGIIGDSRSAISTETKEYILEVCAFNRDLIFQTVRKYSINTTASFRYERYVDAGNSAYFPQKAIAYKLLDVIKTQFTHSFEMQSIENPTVIVCAVGDISKIIGIEFTLEEIVKILTSLSFVCAGEGGNLKVTVPSWRASDVKQVHDLAEEVLRSIDVSRCPRKMLDIKTVNGDFKIHTIKEFLSKNLNEVITNPFISEKDHALFNEGNDDAVILQNPINEELPYMRSSIIPSLLHNIAKAESLSCRGSAIFEIAKVFTRANETTKICIARSGKSSVSNPLYKEREYTIFDVKEDTLLLLENVYGLKRDSVVYTAISNKAFHPYQAFELSIGRNVVATVAQLHPLVLSEFSIKSKVFVGIIHIANIPIKQVKSTVKSGYSPFVLPNISRELSIIVKEEITCLEILRNLQKATKNRFTASITDIYRSEELVRDGGKSILIAFEIFQNTKTMTSDEIENLMIEIIEVLQKSVGAIIRTDA